MVFTIELGILERIRWLESAFSSFALPWKGPITVQPSGTYVFSKARNAALRSKELYSANGGYFVSWPARGGGKGVTPNEPRTAEERRKEPMRREARLVATRGAHFSR